MTFPIFQARQGDVFIQAVEVMPATLEIVPHDGRGRVILALGESTGHAHAIADDDVQLFAHVTPGATAEAAERYLRVGAAGATLRHEEHAAIALPPGFYRVDIQREYSPLAVRTVAD